LSLEARMYSGTYSGTITAFSAFHCCSFVYNSARVEPSVVATAEASVASISGSLRCDAFW
jgi:hypothetical protein